MTFEWKCENQAKAFVEKKIEEAVMTCSPLKEFCKQLDQKTSTQIFDWVDHIALPFSEKTEKELKNQGFTEEPGLKGVYLHKGALLPRIALKDKGKETDLAILVDEVTSFFLMNGIAGKVEGTPFSGYRRGKCFQEGDVCLWAVERRGERGLEPIIASPDHPKLYLEARDALRSRNRCNLDDLASMKEAQKLVDEVVARFGKDLAAWLFLEVEREYWQGKNLAAQIQKNRQDRLGLGWGNHDHHTFRSSRHLFSSLVSIFEKLGFICRERFYAGDEAGWGAQVVEQERCQLTCFLDLDLSPEEIKGDFAHEALNDLKTPGTIGLWCGLHGDSILAAGMHHLEAQFQFTKLRDDLKKRGIDMMEPFSNFEYLKQAFTKGEIWEVNPLRVDKLLKEGHITEQEAEQFLKEGAVGSHLENLERDHGYKGFNQKNVSFIIKKTDPRTLHV